ncbi:response regulator [bacterium]|nr:response regulator [bacterium]
MKKNIRCLIVEDEALSALSLQMELEMAGLKVAGIVATGEQVLQNLEEKEPDIVLMDLKLAGKLDGVEVTRIITERYRIPVIIITGYPDQKLMDETERLDYVRYMLKPLRTDILLKIIAELVDK